MPAVVAAEVPDEPRSLARDGVGDEAGLALRVVVRVGRLQAVLGPRRARACGAPAQAPDQPLESADVRQDQLLAEAGLLELALQVGLLLLVAPLEPLVQDDVRQGAASDEVTRGGQAAALVRRDSLDAPAQPRLERNVLPGPQRQRV